MQNHDTILLSLTRLIEVASHIQVTYCPWLFFTFEQQKEVMDLLLSCSNPQRVFTKIFYQLCSEEKDTRPFLELKCDQNHGFCKLLLQLARKLFNMFAKNYSREINSMLHKKSPTRGLQFMWGNLAVK